MKPIDLTIPTGAINKGGNKMEFIRLTGYGEHEADYPRITMNKPIRPTLCFIKRHIRCSDSMIANQLFSNDKLKASRIITKLCYLGFAEKELI